MSSLAAKFDQQGSCAILMLEANLSVEFDRQMIRFDPGNPYAEIWMARLKREVPCVLTMYNDQSASDLDLRRLVEMVRPLRSKMTIVLSRNSAAAPGNELVRINGPLIWSQSIHKVLLKKQIPDNHFIDTFYRIS